MTNMAQMMQKAQEMKQKMQEMQEKVLLMEVTGESGAGMICVTANGKGELKTIKIEPGIVDPDDIEVLEDLIVAAVNDARNKAERQITEETQKIMSDMGLPAGLDLPF